MQDKSIWKAICGEKERRNDFPGTPTPELKRESFFSFKHFGVTLF